MLSAAGQYVPFAARIEAAGQAAEAEAADGAAQAPAAAQGREEGEQDGSKSSSKSSKRSSRSKSQESEVKSNLRAELSRGGVPTSAVGALAHLSVTLEVLKGLPVEWAVGRLAEKGVTLGPAEWQQLACSCMS